MIKAGVAHTLQSLITPFTQYVHQADGFSALHVSGETRLSFYHGEHNLAFEGLVVDN